VQQVCKSCRTCFKLYCVFYFTCDRSFSPAYKAGSLRTPRLPGTKPTRRPLPHKCETHITSVYPRGAACRACMPPGTRHDRTSNLDCAVRYTDVTAGLPLAYWGGAGRDKQGRIKCEKGNGCRPTFHICIFKSVHSCRRRARGHVPPPQKKNIGKIFSGNFHVKFAHFSGKYHVKFGNFVNFSGIYH